MGSGEEEEVVDSERPRRGDATVRASDNAAAVSTTMEVVRHEPDSREAQGSAGSSSSSNSNSSGHGGGAAAASRPLSFWGYVVDELDVASERDRRNSSPVSDVGALREQLHDFVSVPYHLEKFLLVGVCACVDAFLYVFTLLPIRLVVAFVLLMTGQAKRLKASHMADVMKILVMALCVYILFFFNYSKIYHYVRGETPLKLYVIYNLLEVFDRLFCSFGQSVLYSFFWSMCASPLLSRPATSPPSPSSPSWTYRLLTFAGTITYLVGHSMVLLGQVVALNVALNSRNNDIITLLISNNFVEVKSNVFKRLNSNNIFQIACSDSVERVQVFLFGVIVVIQNLYAAGEAEVFWVFLVLMAEVAVDWIKHCFLIKFNGISATSYSEFCEQLCEHLAGYTSDVAELDVPGYLCRSLGFVPLPLSCLIIRFTGETTLRMFAFPSWLGFLGTLFVCLLLLKLTLKYLLHRYAKSVLKSKSLRNLNSAHPAASAATRANSLYSVCGSSSEL